MSSEESGTAWRDEIDCDRCAEWDGPPPVPLSEARACFPPELGFKVQHADYITTGDDGEARVIPTTVVKHPGMRVQWFPKLPPRDRPAGLEP